MIRAERGETAPTDLAADEVPGTMRRLRIALISLQQPQPGQGARTHLDELRRHLRAAGHEVELCERATTTRFGPASAVRLLLLQVRCAGLIRRSEVVLLRFHPLSILVVLLCRLLRRPVAIEVNGTPDDLLMAHRSARAFARPLRWTGTRAIRLADARIAVSEPLADWCERVAGRRAVVVPNGAAIDRFTPDARWEGRRLPDRYAVFVGWLAPWQGIETLLAAVNHPRWPDGLPLVIAGEGPVRSHIDRAGLSAERLVTLGPIPYERVPGLVAGATVAVAPRAASGWHASPLKVFEAMACSTPVVVTDMHGQAVPVRAASAGLVVAVDDPGALAAAVAQVAADRVAAERMGIGGRQYAVAHGSWTATSARVAEVLEGQSARTLHRG